MAEEDKTKETEAVEEAEVEEELEAGKEGEGEKVEEEEEILEKEKEEPREEKEIAEERVYTIPLKRVWVTKRPQRTPKAVRTLRSFIQRHMKTDVVKIDNELNELLWKRSIEKPPRRVRVRVTKDKEGVVTVYPLVEKKTVDKKP